MPTTMNYCAKCKKELPNVAQCYLDPVCSECELERLRARCSALEQENIRRINHLNRLGTWAQQDPTGPIIAGEIQKWVLAELEAALGAEYRPSNWQPGTVEAKELKQQLEKAQACCAEAKAYFEQKRDDLCQIVQSHSIDCPITPCRCHKCAEYRLLGRISSDCGSALLAELKELRDCLERAVEDGRVTQLEEWQHRSRQAIKVSHK